MLRRLISSSLAWAVALSTTVLFVLLLAAVLLA